MHKIDQKGQQKTSSFIRDFFQTHKKKQNQPTQIRFFFCNNVFTVIFDQF